VQIESTSGETEFMNIQQCLIGAESRSPAAATTSHVHDDGDD